MDDLALDLGNGLPAPLSTSDAASVIPLGDGLVEVRVHDAVRLPATLRLHDGLGRVVIERVVSSRQERFRTNVSGPLIYTLWR